MVEFQESVENKLNAMQSSLKAPSKKDRALFSPHLTDKDKQFIVYALNQEVSTDKAALLLSVVAITFSFVELKGPTWTVILFGAVILLAIILAAYQVTIYPRKKRVNQAVNGIIQNRVGKGYPY